MEIIRILGNRNAGFILGLLSVANLALGSLVMNMNPDIYPPFFTFDLNYFFTPVKPVHFWLYLMIMVFSLFCGNVFFSTIETLVSLIKMKRVSSPAKKNVYRRRMAALTAHLAVILALLSHLYDGLAGENRRIMAGNPVNEEGRGTGIPGLGSLTIKSIVRDTYPDGSTKDIRIKALFRKKGGDIVEKKISYNSPAMFNCGVDEVVIRDGRTISVGLLLADSSGTEYRISRERPLLLKNGELHYLGSRESMGGLSVAWFNWQPGNGKSEKLYMVTSTKVIRHNKITVGGVELIFKKSIDTLAFSALVVHNPSIIISLAGVLLMITALFYMFLNRKKSDN